MMNNYKWGRPEKKGIGTTRIDMRIRKDLKQALDKVPKGERTRFVEQIIEPTLKSLDPGKPCEFVCKLSSAIEEAKSDAVNAIQNDKLDDAAGYITVINNFKKVLKPYKQICSCEINLVDGKPSKSEV